MKVVFVLPNIDFGSDTIEYFTFDDGTTDDDIQVKFDDWVSDKTAAWWYVEDENKPRSGKKNDKDS